MYAVMMTFVYDDCLECGGTFLTYLVGVFDSIDKAEAERRFYDDASDTQCRIGRLVSSEILPVEVNTTSVEFRSAFYGVG